MSTPDVSGAGAHSAGPDAPPGDPALTRRRLLRVGGASAFAAGAAVTAAAVALDRRDPAVTPDAAATGSALVAFHGPHQAGVDTPLQTYAAFAAFALRDGVDRPAAARMMRVASDDAARLTAALPVLGDQEPHLATVPSRLTVTFGFGPRFFDRLGLERHRPDGLRPLPAYGIDRLDPAYTGGDLLTQVCGDDPMVLAHALRQLTKTLRSFARPHWVQRGFTQPAGSLSGAGAPRNLMGQIDGTVNPAPGSVDFDGVVWSADGPAWFRGGTMLVVRRISMGLDSWDRLDSTGKELALGRRLADGAPVGGGVESDRPDLDATDSTGLPVIPPFAHVARAAARSDRERFLRRPYNYDDFAGGRADAGLIFTAYQADIATQYLPVQQRLADNDAMNTWTTPVGSAVFALPPGCPPGGYVGQELLR